MITRMTHVSLVVDDYDEAIEWYTKKLGLELRGDNTYGEGYRFVTVGVKGWMSRSSCTNPTTVPQAARRAQHRE